MKLVIGLMGAKGAGKSTAYQIISKKAESQEVILAGKLKDVCAEVLDVPRGDFDDPLKKEKDMPWPVFLETSTVLSLFAQYGYEPPFDQHVRPHIGMVLHTPRQIAQYVGTEVLRNYDPDVHIKAAISGVTAPVGVVTDIRFPNEYQYFADNFEHFIPIFISNLAAEINADKDSHASEAYRKELAKLAQYTIDNNGTLKKFENAVTILLDNIIGGRNV